MQPTSSGAIALWPPPFRSRGRRHEFSVAHRMVVRPLRAFVYEQ